MEAWADQLLEYRASVWGGCGLLLCLSGGRFRYTSLFLPLLRLGDARDTDKILSHIGRSLSTLTSRPAALHIAVWAAAQTLMLEVAMRAINVAVLAEMFLGGAVACSTLWLVQRPGDFVAVGGIYPRMRQARSDATSSLRRCGSAIALAPMQIWSAPPEWRRVADVLGGQVALNTTAWIFFQFDWIVAVVVNAALGAELLQRGVREAVPEVMEASRTCAMAVDVGCLAAGAWGLARQLREAGRRARQPRRLLRAVDTIPAPWRKVWNEALTWLDGVLLLSRNPV